MKVNKSIISVIFWAILVNSCGAYAIDNPSTTLRIAAQAELLKDHKKNQRFLLYETVNFSNDIPDFLMLDEEFAKNPERLQTFLDHFAFTINNEEIPVYKSKIVTVRKNKPFTFSIIAKRGKLESLLALVKTSTQNWVNSACVKALNLLTYRITYDCPLQQSNIHQNNTHFMADLIYDQPFMVEILKNPSNIMSKVKNYLTWPEWFGLEAKLPEIRYHDS